MLYTSLFGLGGLWLNRRRNISDAIRFFNISTVPPAIIHPRARW
jgi:hypothetical protein